MKEFLKKIDQKKIEINWNKNPIEMETFLSFLTVEVTRSEKHLGSCNGWTQFHGDNKLIITGGVVRGVEYLDNLKYGTNLDNEYNNYINPFYLFEILNDEGKAFFLEYYEEDIKEIMSKLAIEKKRAEEKFKKAKDLEKQTKDFWKNIKSKI